MGFFFSRGLCFRSVSEATTVSFLETFSRAASVRPALRLPLHLAAQPAPQPALQTPPQLADLAAFCEHISCRILLHFLSYFAEVARVAPGRLKSAGVQVDFQCLLLLRLSQVCPFYDPRAAKLPTAELADCRCAHRLPGIAAGFSIAPRLRLTSLMF